MYDSSIPQKTIRLSNLQNFDLHVLVGLSSHVALLQLARQENVRPLRRYSGQRMQPTKTLPGSPRVASLLFQLPFRPGFRVLSIVHQSGGQFEFPALNRMAIIPDEDETIIIQYWDND